MSRWASWVQVPGSLERGTVRCYNSKLTILGPTRTPSSIFLNNNLAPHKSAARSKTLSRLGWAGQKIWSGNRNSALTSLVGWLRHRRKSNWRRRLAHPELLGHCQVSSTCEANIFPPANHLMCNQLQKAFYRPFMLFHLGFENRTLGFAPIWASQVLVSKGVIASR